MTFDDQQRALAVCKAFIDFRSVPEIADAIDGAYDPDNFIWMAENLLDKYVPEWRDPADEDNYVLRA